MKSATWKEAGGGARSWHPACTLSCLPRMVISVLVQGKSWEPDDFQNKL